VITLAAIDRHRRAAAARRAATAVGARERVILFAQVASLAAELGGAP